MAKNFFESQVDFVKTVKFQDLKQVQRIGILSALVLLIGTFLPVATIPIAGSYSIISGGGLIGWLILLSALVSGYLFLYPKSKLILWSNLTALVLFIYSFSTTYFTIAKYQSEIQSQLNQFKNNPVGSYYGSYLNNAFGTWQINWIGWVVMLVGIAGVFYAVRSDLMGVYTEMKNKAQKMATENSKPKVVEVTPEPKMKEEVKKEIKEEKVEDKE